MKPRPNVIGNVEVEVSRQDARVSASCKSLQSAETPFLWVEACFVASAKSLEAEGSLEPWARHSSQSLQRTQNAGFK